MIGPISLQYTAAMPIDVAAEVIANHPLSTDYHVLALAAPAIAEASAPGQFVMIKASRTSDPLLRRPFSIFEVLRDSSGAATGLTILSKRIGPSTRQLYDARPRDVIDCLGPLGRPFASVEPPTDAWLVAGGVGLAPFATLAQSLRARAVSTTLFYGARRAAELFYLEFFRALGVELVLTTEDGTAGESGRVVAPLDRRLSARTSAAPLMLYACGPEGMLAAVARTAAKHGRPCQVSVERVMGCGLGGCYSCVIPVRGDDGRFHHVRSCLAGPVLQADHIRWD
jgi:dihydroorotate dehydrogenase electron transfer subunit